MHGPRRLDGGRGVQLAAEPRESPTVISLARRPAGSGIYLLAARAAWGASAKGSAEPLLCLARGV